MPTQRNRTKPSEYDMTRSEIIPDKLYPLAVYCELTGRTRLAARDRCRRELVPGAIKPKGESQWFVPGAVLLEYYQQQNPTSKPQPAKTSKKKRVQAALQKSLAAV